MTTILKHRRGTTAQHASFTGALGEITVDTDKDTAVVHDGSTVGGFPLLPKTMTDGTANGVLYLNGSKVATSGSALTFDGTNLGLGVTPSAWASGYKAFEFGNSSTQTGALFSNGINDTWFVSNAYFNGTNWIYKGTGNATGVEQAAGAHKWYTAPSGTAGDAITFTQAMTLDASGNLLVGSTSSASLAKLNVYGTQTYDSVNATIANWYSGGSQIGYFGQGNYAVSGGGATNFGMSAVNSLVFGTGSSQTERARIDSSGNLLVARTGNAAGVGRVVSAADGANYSFSSVSGNATTQYHIWFGYGDTAVGSITSNNTNAAYNTSSDYRLKDNQQPLTGSGEFIDALQPKTWEWKADGSKGVGFIAHEVQAVSPSSVVGEKDAVDEEGKPIMQAMEYGSAEFIANIIAELQSLRARVAQLESN